MAPMHDLSSRVALVTGASRGLGAATAERLAQCGAAVAVNYWASADKANHLVQKIEQSGGGARAYPADVRDPASVSEIVRQITSDLGPIDILVLNATGPQPFLQIEELTWQACLDQLEFFVKSPMLLAQAVLPSMKSRRRGRIIHIASEVFSQGTPRFSQYVAAKGAQLGLMRSWAMELAPWQITVNSVSPGWIPTERHANDAESDKRAYAEKVPMKRMGNLRDVADAVAFLASDAANFITGQNLLVNGGNALGGT
ncbi:MAG TPA: SDR family oxidoreductase [Tepidisphaeraceae bacterium]|nr:SDR family oxidoreductase [Tepidisphaeraceae bacterium]